MNSKKNADLYWALRGGGGATWGVVTSLTIRAHMIPKGGFTAVTVTDQSSMCDDGESKVFSLLML